MRISVSPSLIQAGHRGCQISRAILKYSTAVRDQTRVLMLGVLVCRMERRMRMRVKEEEDEGRRKWRKLGVGGGVGGWWQARLIISLKPNIFHYASLLVSWHPEPSPGQMDSLFAVLLPSPLIHQICSSRPLYHCPVITDQYSWLLSQGSLNTIKQYCGS